MPTQTCHLLDAKGGRHTDPPDAWMDKWRDEINASYPPFDPDLTPTDYMGWVAECFRKQKETIRSLHPYVSFAGRGRHAKYITADQPVDFPAGEGSPLAKIYELDGYVLLLGVGHHKSTSLHLAEHRAAWPGKRVEESREIPVLLDGQKEWVKWKELNSDDYSDFGLLGEAFERQTDFTAAGKVGDSDARLMPQAELVDFASIWISQNRR